MSLNASYNFGDETELPNKAGLPFTSFFTKTLFLCNWSFLKDLEQISTSHKHSEETLFSREYVHTQLLVGWTGSLEARSSSKLLFVS